MKQEVRRGRKFIEYHDDEQPEGTFTQEISSADVSSVYYQRGGLRVGGGIQGGVG